MTVNNINNQNFSNLSYLLNLYNKADQNSDQVIEPYEIESAQKDKNISQVELEKISSAYNLQKENTNRTFNLSETMRFWEFALAISQLNPNTLNLDPLKTCLSEIENIDIVGKDAKSDAILALLSANFNKEEIIALLKGIKDAAGEDTGWAYIVLPNAINALLSANFNKEEIIALLKGIKDAAGAYTGEAYTALPAMLKANFNKEEIIDLLKGIKDAAGAYAWGAYTALPAMLKANFNKEEIIDLLKGIKDAAGEYTGGAYTALPAMLKANFNKEEIIALLKGIKDAAGESTWEAYTALPNAINALLSANFNKEEIIALLKGIKDAAGAYAWGAYTALPKAINALLSANLGKEEMFNGLIKMLKVVNGGYVSSLFEAFSSLEGLVASSNFKLWVNMVCETRNTAPSVMKEIKEDKNLGTEEVNLILGDITKFGSSALFIKKQGISLDPGLKLKDIVKEKSALLDIDGRSCELKLEEDRVKHLSLDKMEAYAYRRRGLELKVDPKLEKKHKVVVYAGDYLMGVYDIPSSGNLNEIKLFLPYQELYNLQIYLVKKDEVKSYLEKRKNGREINPKGALFVSIYDFNFIEVKPEDSLAYVYRGNKYNPQYFFDEENLVSGHTRLLSKLPFSYFEAEKVKKQFIKLKTALGGGQNVNNVNLDLEKAKESEKNKYLRQVLEAGFLKQREINQALGKASNYNQALLTLEGIMVKGEEQGLDSLNFGREVFMEILNNLISEVLREEQYLAEQAETQGVLDKMAWLKEFLGIMPNLEQSIGEEYYSPGNSEKMLLANILDALYPGVIPQEMLGTRVPVVENAYFKETKVNENGSYDLVYHFKETGKEEVAVSWKNVFPGTLICRPLHGAAFSASLFPGNYEHGIMFMGVDEKGIPQALSNPSGYSRLSSQIAGKVPSMIKFVQPITSEKEMKEIGQKAVEAAKYLMQNQVNFDMYDPSLPFDEKNRVKDNSNYGYHYEKMYCFMTIIKAYELAGYDITKIDEYSLDYNKILKLGRLADEIEKAGAFTKAGLFVDNLLGLKNEKIDGLKQEVKNTINSIRLDDNEKLSKEEAFTRMLNLQKKPGFPGFLNIHTLASWLSKQDYTDKMLLVKLLYYTGEEIVNGKGVRVIEGEVKAGAVSSKMSNNAQSL